MVLAAVDVVDAEGVFAVRAVVRVDVVVPLAIGVGVTEAVFVAAVPVGAVLVVVAVVVVSVFSGGSRSG